MSRVPYSYMLHWACIGKTQGINECSTCVSALCVSPAYFANIVPHTHIMPHTHPLLL